MDSAFLITSGHPPPWRRSRSLLICPSGHQRTAPWCLDLLSTPVQRWRWFTATPQHLPSISKPPVSPSPPHHICGAEGNDPFGWRPRHFPFNALCLSPTNLLRVCSRLSPSLALCRRVPFHLRDGIHFSRSLVEENEETRPVSGANYCSCTTFGRGGGQKGRASGHYWQCTLPRCLTSYSYKSHGERKQLWLNRWAVQLNFSDAAATICLDCNGFMSRMVPDCWSWLNNDPFRPNREIKPRFWRYK